MSDDLGLRKAVVTVLVGAAISAMIFFAVGWLVPAVVLAGLGSILALELGFVAYQERRFTRMNNQLIEKASAEAVTGRKLVIYERETGLFAHWYISLRCDEECYRSRRYEQPLTVAAIEPSPDSEDPWSVQDFVANWLRRQLRKADLAAYVGNGGYVVVMPQSEPGVARSVVERLRSEIDSVDVGISSFPDDGDDFASLVSAAKARLRGKVETAA